MCIISIERFIHPILACRVVLDIRGQVSNMSQSALVNTVTIPKPQAFVQVQIDSTTTETRDISSHHGQSSFTLSGNAL